MDGAVESGKCEKLSMPLLEVIAVIPQDSMPLRCLISDLPSLPELSRRNQLVRFESNTRSFMWSNQVLAINDS